MSLLVAIVNICELKLNVVLDLGLSCLAPKFSLRMAQY